jgi:hypothetical protein
MAPPGAEAAAVERLRLRLDQGARKLHVLTPAQANGQLLEAIAAACVGLGMAAQRLAAYEAAEVNRVQREGPRQGGTGVAEPVEAEEVAEEAKKLGDQLIRGVCGEDSEEPLWLLEAERLVLSGRLDTRECCESRDGGGCSEGSGGEGVELVAAPATWGGEQGVETAIRLQRAVRGPAARRQLEQTRIREALTEEAAATLPVRELRRLEWVARIVRQQAVKVARREAREAAAAVLGQAVQEQAEELAEEIAAQERALVVAQADADAEHALRALFESLQVTPEKVRLPVAKPEAKEGVGGGVAVRARRFLQMATDEREPAR